MLLQFEDECCNHVKDRSRIKLVSGEAGAVREVQHFTMVNPWRPYSSDAPKFSQEIEKDFFNKIENILCPTCIDSANVNTLSVTIV